MRTPGEYVAKAIRNLRRNLSADMGSVLSHGEERANVTRVGSHARGEDELTTDEPAESVRVLALAADFKTLDKGDMAELDGKPCLITSARTDASGASLSVGLSAALDKFAAQVLGIRHGHTVLTPVDVLAIDNGRVSEYADGFAPVTVHSWTVIIPRESWSEVEPPQIGDEIRLNDQRLKISFVNPREKYFSISARSR